MELKEILNLLLGVCGIILIVIGLIQIFKGVDHFESFVLGFLFIISSQLNKLLIEK